MEVLKSDLGRLNFRVKKTKTEDWYYCNKFNKFNNVLENIVRKQEKEGTNASDFYFIRIAQSFLENKKSILHELF